MKNIDKKKTDSKKLKTGKTKETEKATALAVAPSPVATDAKNERMDTVRIWGLTATEAKRGIILSEILGLPISKRGYKSGKR